MPKRTIKAILTSEPEIKAYGLFLYINAIDDMKGRPQPLKACLYPNNTVQGRKTRLPTLTEKLRMTNSDEHFLKLFQKG